MQSPPPHPRYLRLSACAVLIALSACTFFRGDRAREAPAKPAEGGKLTVAVGVPDAIEPSKGFNQSALMILKLICDPLVIADPETGELTPGAAESWQVSADGKKVTFKLRAGTFHNGRAVAAADYAYALSRFAGKDTGSRHHFFLERVVGYQEVRDAKTPTLSGVKAPDAATLEVELKEPFAEFPAILAHPAAGVPLPKEEVDKGQAFSAQPSCNGPYRLAAAWESGKDIRLVRAKDYKGFEGPFAANGGGFADEIIIKTPKDSASIYKLFTDKKAQIAAVPNEELSKARLVDGRVESGHNGVVALLGFPVTKAPFDNKDLRSALSLSIDREAIVNDLLADTRAIPEGFLPSAAGAIATEHRCPKAFGTSANQDAAKKAFQTSKLGPSQVAPKLYYNPGSGHEKWLGLIAEQWKRILGVGATLTPQGSALESYGDFLAGGPDGPFRWAWPASYPSAESILGPLFAAGSLDNYSRFSNPAFEDFIKKARATPDDEARQKLYLSAAELLCSELPMVPVYFVETHFAFVPEVASASGGRLDIYGDPNLRELGLRSES